MDKTIEVILVATVVLVTGLAVLVIFQGQAFGFDDFLGNQSNDAQCTLIESQARQKADCESGTWKSREPADLKQEYQKKCPNEGSLTVAKACNG